MDGDQGIAELKSLDDAITTVEEVLTPKLNAKFNDYCEGFRYAYSLSPHCHHILCKLTINMLYIYC